MPHRNGRVEPVNLKKLRPFFFALTPQPSEKPVFDQDITGDVERRQEPSLTRKAGQILALWARVGWDGGPMKRMAKWILGAAVVAGGLGLGSTAAQAAEFRVYVGTPVAYVPPCPGPGYEWAAGYYSGSYWVPGRWNFVGVGYGNNYYRVHRDYRDRDDYRYYRDRDDYRDRDHDRDRHDRDDRGDHFRR
jgi:hypothetical protein